MNEQEAEEKAKHGNVDGDDEEAYRWQWISMTMKRITEDDDEEEVKREKPIWNEWGEEWVDEKDDESMPMMHVSIFKTLRQLLF